MQDQPDIEALLRIARRTVLGDFLDGLPEKLQLDARIVANVLAIAAREAKYGEAPLREELSRLTILYDEDPPLGADRAVVVSMVDRLSRRLARDLRHGVFGRNSSRLDKVKAHLVETTVQKLRINNPKYLVSECFE